MNMHLPSTDAVQGKDPQQIGRRLPPDASILNVIEGYYHERGYNVSLSFLQGRLVAVKQRLEGLIGQPGYNPEDPFTIREILAKFMMSVQ